jgi:ribosomal protein S8
MYINFKLGASKGLSIADIGLLQAISQNRTEDLALVLELDPSLTLLDNLDEEGYVSYVKKKKKSDKFTSTIRLTDKGKGILNDLAVPELNDDDVRIYEWLANIYKSTGREIGNTKKTKGYIAMFRAHSGIEQNQLAFLCRRFIDDESQFEWSKRLEYLFWKPSNLFAVRFDINQSKLFQYYERHKGKFDEQFKKL